MTLYSFQAASQVSGGGLRALPSANVTIYKPGTTVRASIYDANGNAISNPGIADANGIFAFTAPEGAYDVVATLGSFYIALPIQVVLAPNLKPIADVNYNATAADCGVTYTALSATRTLTLPPLATMALGKAFPVVDESGNATVGLAINVAPAGSDLISGSATPQQIVTPFTPLRPVAGVNSWVL